MSTTIEPPPPAAADNQPEPEEFASPGDVPTDVHKFGAYLAALKVTIFKAKKALKTTRGEMSEISDEEYGLILEERLPVTQKQADEGKPGTLKYSNDEARERALRETLRTHEEHVPLRDREAALELVVAELEAQLSQARRDFPVLLVDYLATQPVNVQACFAGLQFLMADFQS